MLTTATNAKPAIWSAQQKDIFDWFAHPKPEEPNAVVTARAGTGKTTTLLEGCRRAPEQAILVCAFNKRIAEELTIKAEDHRIQAKTLHAVGFASVKRFRDRLTIGKGTERADALAVGVCGQRAPDTILKLVAKLHTKGREMVPHATKAAELIDIAVQFECEPGEEWADTQFTLDYVCAKAAEAMELASQVATGGTIDFSDMIFLPVRNQWLVPSYDLVVVDEAQDMTTAQLEIAQGVCRGRICVVGDDRQAIYAFRGADSESLSRLKEELKAVEFGLKTTYRCGRVIVGEAQRFVPDFLAGEGNPEGSVAVIGSDKLVAAAGVGDFILSRLNAPLVSTAMSLLRAGKRTRIAGRDIGGGLKTLVRKFKARSVPEFLTRVSAWEEREVLRLTAAKRDPAKIDAIKDQAEMLVALSDGAKNVDEITARIEALFTDDGLGDAGLVTCSSVHRAKGLEANRVFVLRDTLRANSVEEDNISYVAITRAKLELVYVIGVK
jgi:superfamily I DNA/RNA helicase